MTQTKPEHAWRTARPTGLGQIIGLGILGLAFLTNLAQDVTAFLPRADPWEQTWGFDMLLVTAMLLPPGLVWCVCNIVWGGGFEDAGLMRGGVLGLKRLAWAALVCLTLYLLR